MTDGASFLELIAFVEVEFGFTVAEKEMLPENLDSVNNIAAYVVRSLNR